MKNYHVAAARMAAYKPPVPSQDEVIAQLRCEVLDMQAEIDLLAATLQWVTAERDALKNTVAAFREMPK